METVYRFCFDDNPCDYYMIGKSLHKHRKPRRISRPKNKCLPDLLDYFPLKETNRLRRVMSGKYDR